jgi:tetratricopeptide (TPR) repeat protein
MVLMLGGTSPSFADVVSKSVYQQLKKVDRLIAKKSYEHAEQILQTTLKNSQKRYEKAVLFRSLASLYGAQKNYPKAIEFLEKALDSKTLPYDATQKTEFSLGQFYSANKQPEKAFAILDAWFKRNPEPAPKAAIFLANFYSQNKQYHKAVKLVKSATAATEKPPKEWIELQLALGYKTQDYSAAIVVLEKKLAKEPENKALWQQLSAAYHNAELYTKAATIKHLAYQRGFLTTEKARIDLAKAFLYANTPLKAAQFLERQFLNKEIAENTETLELLGRAWFNAKEPVVAKKALEAALALAPKASLYEKLAQIYAGDKQWKQALESFNKALAQGNFEQKGLSQLLLGITHYHLNHKAQAQAAFELASVYPETAANAQTWLNYLE